MHGAKHLGRLALNKMQAVRLRTGFPIRSANDVVKGGGARQDNADQV